MNSMVSRIYSNERLATVDYGMFCRGNEESTSRTMLLVCVKSRYQVVREIVKCSPKVIVPWLFISNRVPLDYQSVWFDLLIQKETPEQPRLSLLSIRLAVWILCSVCQSYSWSRSFKEGPKRSNVFITATTLTSLGPNRSISNQDFNATMLR